MATIVGDPPNILVGSASGTSFVEFTSIMIIPAIVMLVLSILYFKFRYPQIKKVPSEKLQRLMDIDPSKAIEDKPLFIKGIATFGFVILGFILHEHLDYEAALIALSGAALMMLLAKVDFQEISQEIEWDTIFFFFGLFTLAKALEEVGIITSVANWIYQFNSSPLLLVLAILWISAALGGFIGAVPVVTVFIPIVQQLQPLIPNGGEMWWALALGACIGGNLTISGAAANMVAVGLVENTQKKKISFISFLKEGAAITLIGLMVATGYLIVRWYML
jgi:Na+/H+ antiporter NhaD/arsenite permease-like protein